MIRILLAFLLAACSGQPRTDIDPPAGAEAAALPCTVTLGLSAPGHPEADLRAVMDLVDRARARDAAAKIVELDPGRPFPLPIALGRGCEASADSLAAIRDDAARLGFSVTVSDAAPPSAGADDEPLPASLSGALRHLAGSDFAMPDCSLAIELEPSRSAEEDANLSGSLAQARDVYGFPLLFSAQQENTLFVTFYRGCGNPANAFRTLQAAAGGQSTRFRRYRSVSEEDLRAAYGTIY